MDTLSVTSGSVNRREAGVRAPRAPLRLGGGGWGVGGRPVRRRCRRRRRCRILLGRPRAAARRGHADSRVPRLLLPLLPAANRPTSAMARSGRRRAGGGRRAAGGGVARPRVGGRGPRARPPRHLSATPASTPILFYLLANIAVSLSVFREYNGARLHAPRKHNACSSPPLPPSPCARAPTRFPASVPAARPRRTRPATFQTRLLRLGARACRERATR